VAPPNKSKCGNGSEIYVNVEPTLGAGLSFPSI